MLKNSWGLVPLESWCLHKSKEMQVGACNKFMKLVLHMVLLVRWTSVYKRKELVLENNQRELVLPVSGGSQIVDVIE